MIIIEVTIYAEGHVFPHIVKKYVIVITNIFFIYYSQYILTHEASHKRCFGNCSPSPPTSHQIIYRTRLGCIGAEVSTDNNFCN